jgi:cytochrome c biogenesis protein CcmG/thiol:disulfide interchange protein DsbE
MIADELKQLTETNGHLGRPRRVGLLPILAVAVLIAVIIMVGVALAAQGGGRPTSGPAPAFSVQTYDGGTFDLASQRGQIVVLNFWASWCAPCRYEAPALQAIYDAYHDQGVTMIGVTYLDEDQDALAFMDEFGLTYPSGEDVQLRITRDYGVRQVPETFVIDRDGQIAAYKFGPISDRELRQMLDQALAAENGS